MEGLCPQECEDRQNGEPETDPLRGLRSALGKDGLLEAIEGAIELRELRDVWDLVFPSAGSEEGEPWK